MTDSAYETRDVTHNGKPYRASFWHDPDYGAPWKEHDGHGPVSDWRDKDSKAPGEVVLWADRGQARFYDLRGATARATVDGWGLGDNERAALALKLGREPTSKQVTAETVRLDFERLRAWCNDEWHWCGVSVQPLDEDGEPTGDEFAYALWGINSDAGAYFDEVIADLCEQCEAAEQAETFPGSSLGC